MAVTGSLLALLLASGEWKFSSGGLPVGGSSKSLWDLGSDEGFIPYSAFGLVAVLCALGGVACLLLPRQRQRRSLAVSLLVAASMLTLLGWVTLPTMRDEGYGTGGARVILALVPILALAGAVLTLRGSAAGGRVPGMAPPMAGPVPAVPPTQRPPLTARLEEINDLKARDLISDEEFEVQRRRILGTG